MARLCVTAEPTTSAGQLTLPALRGDCLACALDAAFQHSASPMVIIDRAAGRLLVNQICAIMLRTARDPVDYKGGRISFRREIRAMVRSGALSLLRRIRQWMAQARPVPLLVSGYGLANGERLDLHARFITETVVLVSMDRLGMPTRLRQTLVATVAAPSITDGASRNDELRQVRLASELELIARSRFYASAGHDLMQPLSAARLLASALEEAEDIPERARALAASLGEALRGTEYLAEEIIDFARLDGSPIALQMGKVPLGELFANLVAHLQPLAQRRGIRLRACPSTLVIHSDARLLRRILLNLLSNAIRYTRRGGVLIGARRRAGIAQILVCDTGRGIAASSFDDIFRDFHQLGGSTTPGKTGLGLGLAIVKRLSDLLGHEVGVASRLGAGSIFTVNARLIHPSSDPALRPEAAAPPTHRVAGSLHVLSVDDDPDIGKALAALLEHWGVSCENVQTIESATTSAMTRVPDLVLIDYHLDDASTGLDLVDVLRNLWHEVPPIYLLTAERSPILADRARRRHVGLLYKPVSPAALRALVEAIGRQSSPTTTQGVVS